jgi:hypothetical protein
MLVKLKFYFPEVLLGVLLAVMIFVMGMVFQSSRYQPANAQTGAAAQQAQTAHKPEPFTIDWLTHDGVVFFTAVLCFIVFVQAGLFVWQLIVMQKILKEAEANRQAIMRAEQARLWPGFAGHFRRRNGNQIYFGISINNTGRGVGTLVRIYHALVTEAKYQANQFRYEEFDSSGEMFPPNGRNEELPCGIVQIIDVNRPLMISCGYILYTDQYGRSHEQAWKHRLLPTNQSVALPRCYSDDPDKNH